MYNINYDRKNNFYYYFVGVWLMRCLSLKIVLVRFLPMTDLSNIYVHYLFVLSAYKLHRLMYVLNNFLLFNYD